MIKFNKFNVTNGTDKAKVSYSLDNRTDGRKCVTLYAKGYDRKLGLIFDSYTNNTDTQTDYFDSGKVVLFEGDKHYAAARARAEQNAQESDAKYAAKREANAEAVAMVIAQSWIKKIQRKVAKSA